MDYSYSYDRCLLYLLHDCAGMTHALKQFPEFEHIYGIYGIHMVLIVFMVERI